jgi:hypothetical protein
MYSIRAKHTKEDVALATVVSDRGLERLPEGPDIASYSLPKKVTFFTFRNRV